MEGTSARLIVTQHSADQLNRLLGLIISPVGKVSSVSYGELSGCWVEPVNDNADLYRRRLAAAVAGYIIRHWVRELSDEIIDRKYRSLTPLERTRVLHHAAYRMRTNLGRIAGLLAEYMVSEQVVIVEGFATFRVPGLRQDVEDAVDEGVDAVMLDREYRSFLDVVSSVVKRQAPRVGTVHAHLDGTGKFKLVDSENNPVSVPGLDPGKWAGEGARNRHDVLIGALVAAAPAQVIVHTPVGKCNGRDDMLRTVFGSRVKFCHGCNQCSRKTDKV